MDFPCAVNIVTLAGVVDACEVCEPHMAELRRLHGYTPRGKYFVCDRLAPFQIEAIDALITAREQADAEQAIAAGGGR